MGWKVISLLVSPRSNLGLIRTVMRQARVRGSQGAVGDYGVHLLDLLDLLILKFFWFDVSSSSRPSSPRYTSATTPTSSTTACWSGMCWMLNVVCERVDAGSCDLIVHHEERVVLLWFDCLLGLECIKNVLFRIVFVFWCCTKENSWVTFFSCPNCDIL